MEDLNENHADLDKLKEKLKSEIDNISEQLYISQECLKVTDYLLVQESDRDRQSIKTRETFFRWSKHMYMRIVVIELAKLFNRKDPFNIFTFIGSLKTDGLFALINVSIHLIEKWENQLTMLEGPIKKVLVLRHTSFAHKARERPKPELSNVTIEECKRLVNLTNDVVKDVYLHIFHSSYGVGNLDTPLRSLTGIMDRLTAHRKCSLKPLRDLGQQYGINDE